ncbi:hypothetical protein M8C13_00585 [Crossiella sp. SN42]|uniref:hypothetical protein n=1 Tax=Crossiella sp. SN42 TaxID=2944808 RepID=UPI00207D3823|nr:hypothetical protein [Crossiella sp. SN42]MCO1574253.1 hypothetical protein [Crossiella sp. SN42]
MSSQLPEWLTRATQMVNRASDEKAMQDRMNQLQQVDIDLTRLTRRVTRLVAAAEVGRSEWWPGTNLPDDVFNLVAAVRKSFEDRPWKGAEKKLDSLVGRLEAEVKSAWGAFVGRLTGSSANLGGLVHVTRAALGLAEIAAEVESALTALSRVQTALPDEKAMEIVATAAAALDRLATRLPEEVHAFVNAATRSEGVELSALTPAVVSWLTANGVAGEFRIVAVRQSASRGRGQNRG